MSLREGIRILIQSVIEVEVTQGIGAACQRCHGQAVAQALHAQRPGPCHLGRQVHGRRGAGAAGI